MTEHTQEQIEHTARIVAEANGDDSCCAKDPDRYWAWCAASSSDYLRDHRTVARYFQHVKGKFPGQEICENLEQCGSSNEGIFARQVEVLWCKALTEPMAATVALVEAVEGNE